MMVGTIPIIACIPVFILTLFNCKITSLYTITCAHVCASIHFIIHLHNVSIRHDHVDKTNRFLIKRSPWMNIEFIGSYDPVSVRLKTPFWQSWHKMTLQGFDLSTNIWSKVDSSMLRLNVIFPWYDDTAGFLNSRPDRMNTALGYWSFIGRYMYVHVQHLNSIYLLGIY